MITDAAFRLWLKQDNRANRVWTTHLNYQAEESGGPVTQLLRLSDKPYRRGAGRYYAVVVQSPELSRELGGEKHGVYAASYGKLIIDKRGGEFEWLIDAAVDGSIVEFRLGDVAWDVADHRLIFRAKMVAVERADTDTLEIELQDTSADLNKSISGQVLVGGTGPNADKPRSFNFGLVREVECDLVDLDALRWSHSDTGVNTIALDVQVRLESVAFTDDGDGTVRLDDSPPSSGKVTATVLATAPDADPSDTTRHLVSDLLDVAVGQRSGLIAAGTYSGAHPTFVVGDFEDYPIGTSVRDTENTVDFLKDAAQTGQFAYAITRLGDFNYLRIRPNDIAALPMVPFEIGKDDVKLSPEPSIANERPGYYKIRARGNRNWTQTDDVAGDVITGEEYVIRTRLGLPFEQDDAVGTTYADRPELYDLMLVESPIIDTLISAENDETATEILRAWAEVERFNGLPQLRHANLTVGMEFFEKELGDVALITFPFFRMDAGTLAQVVGIKLRPTDYEIDLVLYFRSLSEPYPEGWERITTSEDATTDSSFDYDSTAGPPVVPPPGPTDVPPGIPLLGAGAALVGGLEAWGDVPNPVPPTPAYARGQHFVGSIQAFADFNRTVAMDSTGTLAAVGIPSYAPSGIHPDGSVRVYERSGATWSLTQTLTATPYSSEIGYAVSVADNATVVASENNGQHFHVWTRTSPTTWSHQRIDDLTTAASSNAAPDIAISRDGTVIAYIGSFGDLVFSVWKLVTGTWTHMQTVSLGGVDMAGTLAISPDGELIVVNGSSGVGGDTRILVYQSNPGLTTWSLTNFLSPASDSGNTGFFAVQQIALSADRQLLVAAAPVDQDGSFVGGTVFVYKSSNRGATFALATWIRIEAAPGTNTAIGSVAVNDDGSRIFIGAPYRDNPAAESGALWYVDHPRFLLPGPRYLSSHGVEVANPYGSATNSQRFSESLAVSGDGFHFAVVSADGDFSGADTLDFFHWTNTQSSVGEALGRAIVTGIGSFTLPAGAGELMTPTGGYLISVSGNDAMAPDGGMQGDI